MSRFVIVPTELCEAIHRRITEVIAKLPEGERQEAEKGRDEFYRQLLSYFDKHAEIPSFSVVKK